MTDGICASTCTLFTELMKAQGVRTIAFGGRPQNGPMQAMGGVKGAQVLELPSVAEYLVKAKKLAEKSANTSSPLLSAEELDHWNQVVPIPLTDFPLTLSSAGINLLNAFGPSNDHLPRQFTYEAAECRRFYTLDNVHRQETTWASAADAMFFGGDCVPGSTNATGSLYSEGPSSRQRLLALILEYTSP